MASDVLYERKNRPPLLQDFEYVVGLDIGTIYSGFAYAHRDEIDVEKGLINISRKQSWNSGKPNLISLKTPTCILLDSDTNLVSFGFVAENQFCSLVKKEKFGNHYFFRRFKMTLYEKKPSIDLQLSDVNNRKLDAMIVFARTIDALKQAFIEDVSRRAIGLKDEKIRWVVTVPTIWSDAAKQFMRKAANMAGLPDNQLIIALEPEAASIFCQFVKFKDKDEHNLTVLKPGHQYVVADLGGGTADITVHEIQGNGRLKEVDHATGSDCGGNSINEAFLVELHKTFSGPFIQEIKEKHPTAYFDVHREFEAAKKIFEQSSEEFSLGIPEGFLNSLANMTLEEDFVTASASGPNNQDVHFEYSRLYIKPQAVEKKLFKPTADRIINMLKVILSRANGSNIKKIMLVGGLSDSIYIQKSIKESLKDINLITPPDAELCVVKGSVLFGHTPSLISHRVIRYTYGVKIRPKFDKRVHDKSKKVTIDGIESCQDVFMTYVKVGAVVEVDKRIMNVLCTTEKNQKEINVSLFTSKSESPKYIDEKDCKNIGSLKVEIQNPSDEIRDVEVSIIFGNTELQIHAKDVKTGKECNTSLDFIMY